MFDWITSTTVRTARRIAIGVAGATVVLVGIAMLVLPGPGLVVIGVGLALLSIEFAFAQRWLRMLRDKASSAADGVGIPKKHRRILPIVGLLLAIPMMVLPGFFKVVRTGNGFEVLPNDHFSYAHSWTTKEKLERCAADGDADAIRLLQSLDEHRAKRTLKEAKP